MRAMSLFFACLLVLGASVVFAETTTGFWPSEADTNNDDMISRDEAIVLAHKTFGRYDYDDSSDISMQEWRMVVEDRLANARQENPQVAGPADMDAFVSKTFKTHDANGDDSISLSEWDARVEARFTQLDSNGDGMIVRDEAAVILEDQK